MIENEDRLREAFETHENLAPDPAAVYARVQELARTYHRRRRGLQAAGGAVLGAGLIAGAVNLPAMLPGNSASPVGIQVGAAAPSPSGSPSQAELEKDWAAYFAAGYGYDDAVKLAHIWGINGNDIGSVKAEAGRRLLAGETLPIRPGPEHTTPTSVDPKEQAEVAKFFAAGYTYQDAVKLARLWKLSDPYQAKVEGGKKLLAGETLPIRP